MEWKKIFGTVAGGIATYLSKENIVYILLILLALLVVWCIFIYKMRKYPKEQIEDTIDENGNPKKIHYKFR